LSKDSKEIERVHDVLFEFFLPIRDYFLYAASDPEDWPLVSRGGFHRLCEVWQVQLKDSEIDRVFTATIEPE